MSFKKCTKCKEDKEFSEFYKNNKRSKDGYTYECKSCIYIYHKEYREKNFKKIAYSQKIYNNKNKEKNKKTKQKYISKNFKEIADKQKIYNIKNRELISENKKLYYIKNKEKIKKYKRDNKDKLNKSKRLIRKNNYLIRFKDNLRRKVNKYLSDSLYKKNNSTEIMLGINFSDLFSYLEDNPYKFKCIDNQIDHIIPLSNAKNKSDLIKLFHYKNLQLLPPVYNKHIKGNKKWNKEHFENWFKNIKIK